MKLKLLALSLIVCSTIFAGPNNGGGHRPPPQPRPVAHRAPPPQHHHHNHSFWGRGGSNFWPGFVGGVVGGAIVSAPVVQHPVVVSPAPTIVQQQVQVWVEGRCVETIQSNGVIVRTWIPGHWETR